LRWCSKLKVQNFAWQMARKEHIRWDDDDDDDDDRNMDPE